MKYWLNPHTGVCQDMPSDDLIVLYDVVKFECVRCEVFHTLIAWSNHHVFPFDKSAARVAMYYRSYWGDCQLPTYAPTSRDWGQMWRSMLGWLYSNNASREGVLKTWEVFRNRQLDWLEHKRAFFEVYEQLYDVLSQIGGTADVIMGRQGQGYDPLENVLVVQRERIPVDNTWVADEHKFENSFVRVEGVLHDEEVPLYLVVHVPWDAVTPNMVWVVGRDRHTRTFFALRVPAQFRYLDAALRWTLSAEPWDRIEEV